MIQSRHKIEAPSSNDDGLPPKKRQRKTKSTSKTESSSPALWYHWGQAIFVVEMKPFTAPIEKTDLGERTTPQLLEETNPLTSPPKPGGESEVHQATRYAIAANSYLSPLRRFTPGILIHANTLKLMYSDPSGTVFSTQVDYGARNDYLVALLLALTRCGSHALGFEPAFVKDGDYPYSPKLFNPRGLSYAADPTSDSQSDDATLSAPRIPISSLLYTEKPPDGTIASQFASNDLLDVDNVKDSLSARPLPIKWNGRKPLKAPETGICQPRTYVGGNTSVFVIFTVRRISRKCAYFALKTSWVPEHRVSEAELLRLANKARVPNVAELIASGVVAELAEENSTRVGLIRAAFMGNLHPRIDNRRLRLTVTPEYFPLVQVVDLSKLMSAFLSIIRGTALRSTDI